MIRVVDLRIAAVHTATVAVPYSTVVPVISPILDVPTVAVTILIAGFDPIVGLTALDGTVAFPVVYGGRFGWDGGRHGRRAHYRRKREKDAVKVEMSSHDLGSCDLRAAVARQAAARTQLATRDSTVRCAD